MLGVATRLVAGLAAAALLSGCGGTPEPGPVADRSASPAPSASTSPSASPSTSPVAPVMPAAAKKRTKAGAEAFVTFYVTILNYAGTHGETAGLRDIALPTCIKCKALADGIDDIYSRGGHINGGGWTVLKIRHFGFKQGHYFLDATIKSSPQKLVAKAGAPVKAFPGAPSRLRAFVLERQAGDWKVSELDPSV